MANRLQKTPAVQYTPGTPGAPEVPAHCYIEPIYSDFGQYAESLQWMTALTEQITKQKLGRVYYGVIGTDANGNEIWGPKSVDIPPDLTSMFTGAGASPGALIAGYRNVCYPKIPAVPGTPPRVVYDSLPGWNSGGISIGGFTGDGYVEFQIGPASIGAVVGLNSRSDTVSPADCSHAFYGHQGLLDIFEDGAIVFTVPGGLTGSPTLRLGRAGSTVSYLVNGAVVYISTKPSSGYARLDASLYSAGDYVDNPLIATFNRGQATTHVGIEAFIDPRARAIGRVSVSGTALGRSGDVLYGKGTGDAGVTGSAAATSGNFGAAVDHIGVTGAAVAAANFSHGRGPAATGLSSDGAYAQSGGVYRGGYRGAAEGGFPTVAFAYSVGYMAIPLGYGDCISGGIATSAARGPAFGGISGENGYAQSLGVYRGGYQGFSYEPWLSADSALILEPILLQDTFAISGETFATFTSVVEVEDSITLEMTLEAGFEWLDAILVTDTMAELSDKTADMFDAVYVTDQTNTDQLTGIQMATNVRTGAPTLYNHFDFKKIVHTKGGSIGLKDDGIYAIGGDTDDGAPLNAYVDVGGKDFDVPLPKHIVALFFGLRTNGQVLAVLRDDRGRDRTYRVAGRTEFWRTNPAQGITSKFWRLRLEVCDATQAELDSIEFAITPASRRWTR